MSPCFFGDDLTDWVRGTVDGLLHGPGPHGLPVCIICGELTAARAQGTRLLFGLLFGLAAFALRFETLLAAFGAVGGTLHQLGTPRVAAMALSEDPARPAASFHSRGPVLWARLPVPASCRGSGTTLPQSTI
ncbi:hypothetical protein SBA4_3560005 [Candidatus Sulfopaludibacter sp. SbA4]|nr:hypothetical protein SBA4_3560005 [Candidatus Sulfopaludibacter sp. SbA4]